MLVKISAAAYSSLLVLLVVAAAVPSVPASDTRPPESKAHTDFDFDPAFPAHAPAADHPQNEAPLPNKHRSSDAENDNDLPVLDRAARRLKLQQFRLQHFDSLRLLPTIVEVDDVATRHDGNDDAEPSSSSSKTSSSSTASSASDSDAFASSSLSFYDVEGDNPASPPTPVSDDDDDENDHQPSVPLTPVSISSSSSPSSSSSSSLSSSSQRYDIAPLVRSRLAWRRLRSQLFHIFKGSRVLDEQRGLRALPLHSEAWLETLDDRHRYGPYLAAYHEAWKRSSSSQPFFVWLDADHGEGRAVDLPSCPRAVLDASRVEYIHSEQAAQRHELVVSPNRDGKLIYRADGRPFDTPRSKRMFVLTADRRLFVGERDEGRFCHASLSCGRPVFTAGEMYAVDGKVTEINLWSGHFRPTPEHLRAAVSVLRDMGLVIPDNRIDYELPDANEFEQDEDDVTDLSDSEEIEAY